jgi:hypothetical protein
VKYYGLRSINSLILFGIRKNFLISGRSLLFYQFTRRAIKLTVVIIVGYHCYQPHTIMSNILFLRLSEFVDEIIWDVGVGFNVTGQLLNTFFAFFSYWRRNESTMRQYISFS